MSKIIRIGTRDSELALWQAHTVQKKLNDLGYKTEIVAVKSQGDIILDKPLYELGITGIFTKTLDIAMINGQVDIAVHSMKDVPTALPIGIVQAAVLERALGYNAQFEAPLPVAEVKATAKSIARWTYAHLSPAGFSRSQARKGTKGGKRSGEIRRAGSTEEAQPWLELGISRATYYRRKQN